MKLKTFNGTYTHVRWTFTFITMSWKAPSTKHHKALNIYKFTHLKWVVRINFVDLLERICFSPILLWIRIIGISDCLLYGLPKVLWNLWCAWYCIGMHEKKKKCLKIITIIITNWCVNLNSSSVRPFRLFRYLLTFQISPSLKWFCVCHLPSEKNHLNVLNLIIHEVLCSLLNNSKK